MSEWTYIQIYRTLRYSHWDDKRLSTPRLFGATSKPRSILGAELWSTQ